MSAFDNAMKQLSIACEKINLEKDTIERLKRPDRIFEFKVSAKMDNGETREFNAYRVQYNNALGPYKGGIRFHPQVDIEELKALAFWMAIKTAVANIPMGGSKGGIEVNPKDLSETELELISRTWVDKMAENIGQYKDVPAPDVNTNSKIIDWMSGEYKKITSEKSGAAFTGKSIQNGGIVGRDTATGQGAFYILEKITKKFNLNPNDTKIIVQGIGNVGYNFADISHRAGYKIVGISDSKGGIYNPLGINPAEVMKAKEERGSVICFDGAQKVDPEIILEKECDILAPAALENQITGSNAAKVKAKIILELANGPTTPDADLILSERKICVVPDVLANSGGVIVSYFEWLQNISGKIWSEQEVLLKLGEIIKKSFDQVWEKSKAENMSPREAAFVLAIQRIVKKMK